MRYYNLEQVFSDRRKGVNLSEVFDNLLQTPEVWTNYGPTPFSAIVDLYPTDHLDFTSPTWKALDVEDQIRLSTAYQHWYADHVGVDVELEYPCPQYTNFRLIPPAKYEMGIPYNDQDLHKIFYLQRICVIKKAFWISKYPITVSHYNKVTQPEETYQYSRPITYVTLTDCKNFCKLKKTKVPTEEQWELACRAGTTTTYFFGEDVDKLKNYAWYEENSWHPEMIGQLLPNAFGLHDMLGNVWEICQRDKNITGKERSTLRFKKTIGVRRGGSYRSEAVFCESASRVPMPRTARFPDTGFRIVKDL